MQRVQEDATPAEEYLASLNATCNRLSTQYLNLLKASSATLSSSDDPKGGGMMRSSQDPPPPPLAAHVSHASLQCQLATDNISVATSQLLTLIRTMRLSLLLMDTETMQAEESLQVQETEQQTREALAQAAALEQELQALQRTKYSNH